MRTSLTLFSPAKINVFFRVLCKREDGYHTIASVVQCVDFGDTLTIFLTTKEDRFSCSDTTLSWNSSNLIYRAVELFRQQTQLRFYVSIHLQKRIPMQAGLGGGSSNAATVLYALNTLLQTGFSDQQLGEIGSVLGADVPCFFGLGRVFCEGIGEKVTLLEEKEEECWLAKPMALFLATPHVYACCTPKPGEVTSAYSFFDNDLEEAAFSLLPSLAQCKNKYLELGFTSVTMTGSGTAFVCRGNVKNPYLPNTIFIKVKSLFRQSGQWYLERFL